MFKDNLEKWSNDLHCVVQLLKKIPQTEENVKCAQECIDTLFKPAKTEHYGSFQCSEYGTRKNFQNLNFAIPLVILTWHQMLQEFFWKNSDHTFFELGNYCRQRKKNTKQLLDNLHMIDGLGDETKLQALICFVPIMMMTLSRKCAHHYSNGQITYWNHMKI
jgi:hypothetical protein